MTRLAKKDLHVPFNNKTLNKVASYLLRGRSEQAVAATAAGAAMAHLTVATQNLTIRDAYFLSASAAGVGESMAIDLLVNGASILTAPYTFDATAAAKTQIKLPVDPAKQQINIGDKVTVSRTYVAGGGPTMTASVVVVEPSPNDTE